MVILIDTNIILDVLEERKNFVEQSSKVLELCAKKVIKGYIAFHSVSNIFFILRKKYSKSDRRELLSVILDILEVTGASHEQVKQAIAKEYFDDFEDCLQDECAKAVKAEYIITRNKSDFSKADTKAITPEEFINMYYLE
ncbi:PIN domain-containing protein [Eubacterium sp. MSJ-13]|uniref:type II toxin-antitoxin system VapC family toxin n=1 Tax=Eubacterium sp. MSJ-13 TaxID=2841513 RepID=UPI001C114CEF|nr:PIN domain-containing protein [Eubacterium sp. MSJ-13]MBU5477757.1 PIN domain-containing protein [Eubacterium sp. MSJ-13]